MTVRFPHRPRRGLLLGLSWAQLGVTASALCAFMIAVMATGILGAVTLLPLWATVAVVVLIRRAGRPLVDWAPIVARYLLRRWSGQQLWLARPVTRPQVKGLLHLPGTTASLRALSPAGVDSAALHDPRAQTLTAVARISARAFALLDPATQNSNVAAWGRMLAGISRAGQVKAVQVLERTVPDSGDALARHWQQHGQPNTPVAGQIYSDLVASAGPATAPHEAYLVVALDLKAARRLVSQAGGGLPGAFTVLSQTTASIGQAARNAGLTVTGWLSEREIAAVIRTAYDPTALSRLQHWSPSGRAEADPAAAGPVVQVEESDRLITDTAQHATYWVENWPRTETGAGFLHQLLFTAAGARRSFSLIYAPQALDSALRDVQRRKATVIADAAERQRKGLVDSEANSIEYADAKQRERELIAGHADVALTGLLTLTAETRQALDAACASVETAAAGSQIDLRRLTYQQPQGFTLAALPLARAAL